MSNQSVDIVFAGIPWVGGGAPLMAPALLKSIVQLEGYSAVGIDLNIEVTNHIIETFDNAKEALHVANFIAHRRSLNLEYYNNHSKFFHEQITYMAERILSYNPSHIGLSLLSTASQFCTEYLALRLRQLAPNKKIVIGGPGMTSNLTSKENTYAEYMKGLNFFQNKNLDTVSKNCINKSKQYTVDKIAPMFEAIYKKL